MSLSLSLALFELRLEKEVGIFQILLNSVSIYSVVCACVLLISIDSRQPNREVPSGLSMRLVTFNFFFFSYTSLEIRDRMSTDLFQRIGSLLYYIYGYTVFFFFFFFYFESFGMNTR